ncbi:type IV pilus assembly PilZ [Thermodesulfatator indicus DSM 15286]|uniref:Type IV pilus assembly PilZ n=1 Tax=Thermodesulfatator indicus (strain DSM 15286 / JCM 11887 / CIR29812) TaxID=667014 RepID=F8A942_THEID|nr:TIGR02266 family protein [Thermodesulfatator indicus]AEH45170.1 type IV pilus assembly PilZ [Thermodesulfatator indicus DSM 15286]
MEKRKCERIRHVFRVDYSTPEALFNEFAENISEGGLFIQTNNPLEIGTEIVIEFMLPFMDEPIKVKGRVEWHTNLPGVNKNPPGMGVSFQKLSTEDKEKINEVVRKLKAL